MGDVEYVELEDPGFGEDGDGGEDGVGDDQEGEGAD